MITYLFIRTSFILVYKLTNSSQAVIYTWHVYKNILSIEKVIIFWVWSSVKLPCFVLQFCIFILSQKQRNMFHMPFQVASQLCSMSWPIGPRKYKMIYEQVHTCINEYIHYWSETKNPYLFLLNSFVFFCEESKKNFSNI